MNELTFLAKEYAAFYANGEELSVIAGDGAEIFADAIRKVMTNEQRINFVVVDETVVNNDEEHCRAVIKNWLNLTQKGMAVVAVINRKQKRLRGRFGVMLERFAHNVMLCKITDQGNLHISDFKNRREKELIDMVINTN